MTQAKITLYCIMGKNSEPLNITKVEVENAEIAKTTALNLMDDLPTAFYAKIEYGDTIKVINFLGEEIHKDCFAV